MSPLKKPAKQPEKATEDFVQDRFYERGNRWLKTREIVVSILLWIFLVYPILVLFNSVNRHTLWEGIYHWAYTDGFQLDTFLKRAILIIVVVVLGFSIYLLLRNNHRERKVYPVKKTFDGAAMERRKQLLEAMYAERFGDERSRHQARYYVVAPEQNLPTHFISDTFKQGGMGKA
ncbi:MAG: hypothetical protein LBB54_04240 [Cellulomonadaceae bacterium]|jgi:hypothetical protein|nr:hypothetical protein [Cellulomonadaceae bacterium]